MPEINRRWLLAARPVGMVKDSDFKRVDEPVPEPGAGEFLVRQTHLSFDPTQRGWISVDTYLPAVKLGDVVRAGGVGQVVKSNHPNFKVGQLVQGGFGWQDYMVTAGQTEFMPVQPLFPGVRPEQALSVFGITGLTAWFGLTDIGKPKAGETVVVSGAAGATGSVVVQIAKALGCTVVGIAGGAEKCAWVKDVAGADACVDYKAVDVLTTLKRHTPKGIDVVFENVGGRILEASMLNLAQRARIVLCGAISGYNAETGIPDGIRTYMMLTQMRARMEGFIVLDYAPRYGEGVQALARLMAEGKLKTAEDVQEGFDNIPATLRRLFEGKNLGKQLLKIADPPLPVV